MGLQGIDISRIVKGVNKYGLFSFEAQYVRTNKF
jgi:hypothetical protein